MTILQRDFRRLTGQHYDLLVIGGGIHGACVAWDATLRGLRVALLERHDFGAATSANSLKTIHGGLRYLQDGSWRQVRMMIQERRAWLRIAPHLVHPLPFLLPTYRTLGPPKWLMRAALQLNDWLSFDRNRLVDPQKHLPASQILSKTETLRRLPGLDSHTLTGGALWHDAQMLHSERLTLAVVLAAAAAGADVFNYVEATDFLCTGRRITGVRAHDTLSGAPTEVHARIVVNTAGPWADELLRRLGADVSTPLSQPSLAMNLVTRQIVPDTAAGLPSKLSFQDGRSVPLKKPRILFIVPWRQFSLVGTAHFPAATDTGPPTVSEQQIRDFLAEVNAAYPAAQLTRDDIYAVQAGILPAESHTGRASIRLVRESRLHDHYFTNGMSGLISVVGVKYTTARHTAQRVVNTVFDKLGQSPPPCRTAETPLYGGEIPHLSYFLGRALAQYAATHGRDEIIQLVQHYGSAYPRVLACLGEHTANGHLSGDAPDLLRAQILYAVRHELAQTLSDVIWRRTALGSTGRLDPHCLRLCAEIMAAELGWDQPRLEAEIHLAAGHQPEQEHAWT